MSDLRKDTFSRFMAFLAIAIAVASFAYTIWSDQKSEMENLLIYTSRVHSDYETEIIPFSISDFPAVLLVYYECLLVNNGKTPLLIVDYDLKQIAEDYPIKYSYMDGRLFDDSLNQLQLPLEIDSKKSYRFFVKVGLTVYQKAYELISKNFISLKRISIQELNSYLARNHMDLYGNTVTPHIDQDKSRQLLWKYFLLVQRRGAILGLRLTQHIRYELTPLPFFETLLPTVVTSYILESLAAISIYKEDEND